MLKVFISLLISFVLLFSITNLIRADEISDIQKQIDDLQKQLELSKNATTPLESEVKSLEAQLASIRARLGQVQKDIQKSEDELVDQKEILAATVRNFYIRSFVDIPLLTIFASSDASETLKLIAFQATSSKEDKDIIRQSSEKIAKLADVKKRLASAQGQINKQSQFLKGEIASAKAFQSELSGKIAALSARQQEIISARSGQFTASIGDSELADDYNASIKGFRESAPSGSFAVFSFGAYTHRNGMSQYGALGHVKNQSWNYEQILKYYYPGISINKIGNDSITVNGTNSYKQSFNNETYQLEDYLKHIYEVPSSWPTEILKAQAIAARSYAYGKSTICPGQGCQEFKREENAESWKQAVRDTEGLVMSGGPSNWQYSSTTGGWVNGLGWDTTDGQGGSSFIDKSFEKIAGSPWVYKAWYTETYRNNSDKCGRSNAWLSPEEMADIVNAAIALSRDGIDTSRITPVTTSCWGGNPYSISELRDLVSGSGGISSASSASVSQGSGTTGSVTINGKNISGADFKRAFNLRAPGRLSIPQSGFAFFNIEKK